MRQMPKCYILVLDSSSKVNFTAVHRYILDSKYFASYWNYIPFMYCLKTELDIYSLQTSFVQILGGENFFLTEIDPNAVGGWLPMVAWDWFKHDHRQIDSMKALNLLMAPPQSKPGSS
jgi:hypothetical protein